MSADPTPDLVIFPGYEHIDFVRSPAVPEGCVLICEEGTWSPACLVSIGEILENDDPAERPDDDFWIGVGGLLLALPAEKAQALAQRLRRGPHKTVNGTPISPRAESVILHPNGIPDPLAVACPVCRVAAHQPCDPRTLGAHRWHRARVEAVVAKLSEAQVEETP